MGEPCSVHRTVVETKTKAKVLSRIYVLSVSRREEAFQDLTSKTSLGAVVDL